MSDFTKRLYREAQGTLQGEIIEYHQLEKVLEGQDTPILVKQRF